MKIRLASSPTTLLLNNKCLGSTIICVCLRKHRKIYFLPNCRYPHTAAGWAGSGCRAIYPLSPVLSGPLSLRMNSVSGCTEKESVSQFFHILGSVEQQRGCCDVGDGKYEITLYTSCCNASKGIYYYTTYENRQITAVDMHHEALASTGLVRYPLIQEQQVKMQN